MIFKFGEYKTEVYITHELPTITCKKALFVCDENTKQYADSIIASFFKGDAHSICVIKSGEQNKNWDTVLQILKTAHNTRLGRDGTIIGVGGGVIGDISAFAASIYMRGCRLKLVSTTLLAMVDASVGGKTGFDLFDIKNLAGTFYPAETVYMPLITLKTLPEREYKSGMAELIKTQILSGDFPSQNNADGFSFSVQKKQIEKAVKYKGNIVQKDFKETKGLRALLNLGHTFAHALETAQGLGSITHGEAVAWGIVQACNLGVKLKITPEKRANQIIETIKGYGYDTTTAHPLTKTDTYKNALLSDKKNKNQSLTFIVPNKKSAQIVNIPGTINIEELFL